MTRGSANWQDDKGKMEFKKPKVWPPVVRGWQRGDGSWRWDGNRAKPYGLAFNVGGSKQTVWGATVNDCIIRREELRTAAAETEEQRQELVHGNTTVLDVMEQWCAHRRGGKEAPTTQEDWVRSVEFLRASPIAGLRAREVVKGDVRRYLTWLVDERNQGESSVRHRRQHLAAAFDHGIDDGYLTSNPARGVTPPGRMRMAKEPQYLTSPEDFAAMRKYLADDPTVPNVALLLMLLTGARGGEVLALTWDAIDLDNAVIDVRQAVQRSNAGRVRTVVPNLKTKASARQLDLTPDAVRALRTLRTQRPFGLVFADPSGVRPIRAESVYYFCEKACQALGLPRLSPHKLRHSNASMLMSLGESPAEVAAHLGHGDLSTLPDYVHPMKRRINTAALLGDGTAG